MQLGPNLKVIRVKASVAGGQTEVDSSVVDRAGFEGVMFLIQHGTSTSGTSIACKAQSCASDGSSPVDLTGTTLTATHADDGKQSIIDIAEPQSRYLRCVVTPSTQNAAVDSIIALLYRGRRLPITDDASVAHIAKVVSP